jgi:hypothetical protein
MVHSVSTRNPIQRGSAPQRASRRLSVIRSVAHVAAAVLAVTAMLAAMWAGPLAAASAGTQPRAAVRSPAVAPAPVKFYIVPPPGNGPADSLFTIAAKTLGDGSQFMEIFNLNKGRLQPNGGRLTNPQLIEPGWILQLPADAAGPGVHFGPLPVVTAPVSHRSSRPAGTGSAAIISGAVLAFLTAGLAFRLIRRRAGPTRRRRPAHARAPGRAGRAPRRGLQHDHDRSMAPPSAPAPPGRAVAQSGSPARRGPPAESAIGIQRWAAPLDNTPGPAPQTCRTAGRPQVVVTGSPAGDRERATGPGARGHQVLHRPAGQPTADPFRAQQSVRLANPTLPDAGHPAAGISQQTPTVAAAPRQACERDAAQPRSALMEMRAELDQVAACVAGTLQSTMTPMTAPAARPKTQPAARRTTKPVSRPAIPLPPPAEPVTRPAKPAAQPAGRPRQVRAMRLTVLAMTIPILFGLISATGELALHGYGFFVFRSAGTGATQQGRSGPALSQPPAAHLPHRIGSGQADPREARHQQDQEGHDP